MNWTTYRANTLKQKFVNLLYSLILLAAMVLLLGFLGWFFAGSSGVRWAILVTVISLIISPRLSPKVILRWYGARPLSPRQTPALYSVLRELVQRAKLSEIPTIYYVPKPMLNAFTTGSRGNTAIAITGGLVNTLSMRELSSVMAHEIAHLKNNDLWIMNLSDTISRVTSFFSMFGQFLLLLNLPLLLASGEQLSWTGILVLILAPTIVVLLQLALSRTREFEADVDAAVLTGDPEALASALSKMERHQGGWLSRILFPGYRKPQSSMLRTHPDTRERINRLLSLVPDRRVRRQPAHSSLRSDFSFSAPPLHIGRHPGWRLQVI